MIRTLAVFVLLLGVLLPGMRPRARELEPAIRITSPLGRAALPGTIRIVARVDGPVMPLPPRVHFYVDKLFLSSDMDGPPFDALWTDDNPFEKRELIVEAELSSGRKLRDVMVLKPLEVKKSTDDPQRGG